MIRVGAHDDIDRLIPLAKDFWAHTDYQEEFYAASCGEMMKLCVDQGLMTVLEVDGELVGFACGIMSVLMCTESAIAGTELAWWVDPEHRGGRNGIGLLRQLEKQAKDQGIKYWNMAFMQSSMPECIEGIYVRMGYEKTETLYQKVM